MKLLTLIIETTRHQNMVKNAENNRMVSHFKDGDIPMFNLYKKDLDSKSRWVSKKTVHTHRDAWLFINGRDTLYPLYCGDCIPW